MLGCRAVAIPTTEQIVFVIIIGLSCLPHVVLNIIMYTFEKQIIVNHEYSFSLPLVYNPDAWSLAVCHGCVTCIYNSSLNQSGYCTVQMTPIYYQNE